jgi:UDP:flavonoid glycosyltransferase YjiC (YdhE family)
LAAGGFYDRLVSREIPGNIFVYRTAPQLQILQKAQLMITHGGINSVKECIRFGVPMMIYPLRGIHDSVGCAARVVYHNLGRRGNALTDPPLKVEADIDSVRQNKSIRKNILEMRSAFLRHESNEPYIIDDMLSYAHPPDIALMDDPLFPGQS